MLTLNVSKTNYMVMNNRGKKVADAECNIEIYGKIIERISQCKFDNKLTWKCHIDYICPSVPLSRCITRFLIHTSLTVLIYVVRWQDGVLLWKCVLWYIQCFMTDSGRRDHIDHISAGWHPWGILFMHTLKMADIKISVL